MALIFLPLTFITGLFGMNVPGIPLVQEAHAFWYITAFCVFVALVTAVYFWARRWLG